MERVILHSDLNNFYASVECNDNPGLKNYPVAVCGDEELRHGVVLAKNYIAKSYGVKTGDVIWQAKQKCPFLKIVKADFSKYMDYSQRVRKIYEEYTDMVENFGIDECWLDCTNSTNLFGDGKTIAYTLKERIKKEVGLTVSVGVSFNKVFAKLGSDYKKPDAVTIISKSNFKDIVYPLDIKDLLYIGNATEKKLNKVGIYHIGDIERVGEKFLKNLLGKWGEYIYSFATGTENSEVKNIFATSQIKSIGNSITLPKDILTTNEFYAVLSTLAQSVASRLKKRQLYTKKIGVGLRYNNMFSHYSENTLKSCISSYSQILNEGINVLDKARLNLPVRSISLHAGTLCEKEYFQDDFFGEYEKSKKQQKIDLAIEKIRARYGYNSVRPAVSLLSDVRDKDIEHSNIIHPHGFF